MKVDEVASSGDDEFYTPAYAIEPLLKYLNEGESVWCPFDTEESFFVDILRKNGHTVTPTHIDNGYDFFNIVQNYTDWTKKFSLVLSNPPYSEKSRVLRNLFDKRLRFGMLIGSVGVFETQERYEMFRDNIFEVMYFNRRIAYMRDFKSGKTELNPPFSSMFLCSQLLPKQIVFEEVVKANILPKRSYEKEDSLF